MNYERIVEWIQLNRQDFLRRIQKRHGKQVSVTYEVGDVTVYVRLSASFRCFYTFCDVAPSDVTTSLTLISYKDTTSQKDL